MTEDQNEIHNRIQEFYSYDKETWSAVENIAPGIFVYRDVVPSNSINRLEEVLQDSSNNYNYQDAYVGYGMKIPEYRDCVDFKYKKTED